MKKLLPVIIALAIFGMFAGIGSFAWFEFSAPTKTCVACHEIRGAKEGWAHGSHTNVSCKACHGGTASSVAALQDNIRRAWKHVTRAERKVLRKDMPLSEAQVERMSEACGKCHQAEYAQWARSGHSSPVADFLTNTAHNAAWKPADQCLRCHGMFLEGTCANIVRREPAKEGAKIAKTMADLPREWKFNNNAQARRAAVPCLACHRGHPMRGDDPSARFRAQGVVSFYSRPEQMYFELTNLYSQHIVTTNGEKVARAQDAKSKLCYQCHAANAFGHLGTSDDRTPTGAHAGLSCTACHGAHCGDVRKSCGTCHAKCVWPKGVKSPIHGR